MCWLEAEGPSRFVASGYKGICTGGVRTVQCGNFPVFLFFFKVQDRLSFYFLERKGQSLLPSLASCKHKICPVYPCAHKHHLHSGCACLEMDSSSQVQILVSSSYSFCSTALLFTCTAGVPTGICNLRTMVSSNS